MVLTMLQALILHIVYVRVNPTIDELFIRGCFIYFVLFRFIRWKQFSSLVQIRRSTESSVNRLISAVEAARSCEDQIRSKCVDLYMSVLSNSA